MSDSLDPYYQWLGIPPGEQPPSAYRLLGLRSLESDPEVIQNAADRQMLHLRTYQLGQHVALAERLLNEVAAARLTLLNPEKKAEYDRRLSEELQPRPAMPTATWPALGETALLGVPRATSAAPLAPVRRRRFRPAARRLVSTVVVVALFVAALGLLGHAFSSLLSGGGSSPPPEPQAVSPVEPAPHTTVSPLPPTQPPSEKSQAPIVIESPSHRPGPPR